MESDVTATPFRWPPLVWQGACALSLGGYAAAALSRPSGDAPRDFLRFFTIFTVLSALWGIKVWMARKSAPSLAVILSFAVLFRAALLAGAGDQFLRNAPIASVDLISLWLIARLAERRSAGNAAVLAYAWNPLVIWEFAGAGRLDGLGVCALLAAASARPALLERSVWVLGALLAPAPLLGPAHLTLILPFAALRWSWFWLALSGSAFLSYHAQLSFGTLRPLVAIEYAVPLAAWLYLRREADGGYVRNSASTTP